MCHRVNSSDIPAPFVGAVLRLRAEDISVFCFFPHEVGIDIQRASRAPGLTFPCNCGWCRVQWATGGGVGLKSVGLPAPSSYESTHFKVFYL